MKVAIISASVRLNNNTQRVATFINDYVLNNTALNTVLLDLNSFNFPLFNERLSHQSNPLPTAISFAQAITQSQGVIIVTPEYNGGYPAALKNAIDLLYAEWYHKPVAISTVSDGAFGGSQVVTSLQFVLWKMKAIMVPAQFPHPNADKEINAEGKASTNSNVQKRIKPFIDELIYCMEAVKKMS